MNLKSLMIVRPKAETAEALRASLEKTRTVAAEARARVEELERQRGDVLLNGAAAEVKAAEEALMAARMELERAEALMPVLEGRLATTERKEQRAALKAQVEEANAQAANVAALLRTRYVELAEAMVREVLAPEKDAWAAQERAARALDRALESGLITEEEMAGELTLAPPALRQAGPELSESTIELWKHARLPSLKCVESSHGLIWPPYKPVHLR